MPVKIPVYQQQTTPSMAPQPRAGATPVSGAVGQALSQLGAAGTAFAGQMIRDEQIQSRQAEAERKRQELEDAKVWTAEAMSRLRIHADEKFRERQKTAAPGAADFTKGVVDDFDTFSQETLKNAPDAARPMTQQAIANVRDNVAISARTYETSARIDWRKQQIASAIDNTSRLVFNDPSQFSVSFAEQRSIINSLDVPQSVKDSVSEVARKKIANSAVSGWIIQNPQAAFGILKTMATDPTQGGKSFQADIQTAAGIRRVNVPWGDLTVAEQQHWLLYSQTLGHQTDSLEKRRMVQLMKDVEAAADNGISTPVPDSAFSVFGEESPAIIQQYRNSQVMADNISKVATLPVADRITLVESNVPKEGGPGFAEAEKRATDIARAVNEANRRQAEDPAAYAIQVAPQTVGKAFTEMQSSSSAEDRRIASQAYADAVVAEQERLGSVPTRRRLRGQVDAPILPKGMAQAIAKQFLSPKEGGQGPAQLLQSQADTWGDYWPAVYKQIAKDIGPTARVVANLRDTPAAALLSMNAALPTKVLREAVPAKTDASTVDETVNSELAELRESLVGWTTGGSQTYSDYEEAAKRNAYVYAAQGTKPSEAGKRAVQEIVREYYDFQGTVRIPRLPNVDVRAVGRGMDTVLGQAETLNLRVPEDARRLGSDFTADQIAKSVKANGFFTTLGDDSGVALWLRGANGERPVEGADGPITFTWRELMERAAASVKRPAARSFTETPRGAATGVQR